MSNDIDEFLKTLKVHNKDLEACFNDAVAVTHLKLLIAQETNKAYDEGYEAGEKAKPPKLVDAIEFRQEQYGWNDTKMAAMLDLSKSHYSEFKSGKRGLPVNSIRKAYAIGIPASVLLADDIDHQLTADKESKE